MDKNQIHRYSEAEKAIIKKTFHENDLALYAIRNLFWQLELTADEQKALNFQPDQLVIIKKVMLPDIEREVPLGQQADFTLDPLLSQLYQMSPGAACTMMDACDLRTQYLEQQFEKLVSKQFALNPSDIVLRDLRMKKGLDQDEKRHIEMLAYKSIRDYIDGRVNEFKVVANPPIELTPAQKAEKAKKDSNK